MLKSEENKNKKRYPWRENLSWEEIEYLKQFKEDMRQALQEVEDYKKGKINLKSADDLLKEL